MKYVGPTKKMMKALEDEGLYVDWPKTGVVKDEELLAIESTFTTGPDWEKGILIDLRHMGALDSKTGVDNAVANQLQEEYDNFDIDEEVKLNLEGSESDRLARGIPDAVRLLEDMWEQEKKLKRFAEVANAVASGKPVPPESDNRKIEIDGNTAEQIVALLEYAKDYLDPHATVDCLNVSDCMDIINELKRKLEG